MLVINKIVKLSMLTIPVNNAQNGRGNNERKPSHITESGKCSYARKQMDNASANVVREIAVDT